MPDANACPALDDCVGDAAESRMRKAILKPKSGSCAERRGGSLIRELYILGDFMQLMVLCGGYGSRLASELDGTPKALASVNGTPFLQILLQNWRSQGQRAFTFLLFHHADQIIRFLKTQIISGALQNCVVNAVQEREKLGTGGAVKHAIEEMGLSDPFLLANADTWIGEGIQRLTQAGPNAIALVPSEGNARFGQVKVDGAGTVLGFAANPQGQRQGQGQGQGQAPAHCLINAGMYCFAPDQFNAFGTGAFSLEERLLPKLARTGRLKSVILDTGFVDIGVPEDYHRFVETWKAGA